MRKKLLIFVLSLVFLVFIAHFFDLDDRIVYLWSELSTSEQEKQRSVWLNQYKVDIESKSLSSVQYNLSGITFNPDTGHLWVITNQPQTLVELDNQFQAIRTITLKNFDDTEGIAYAGNNTYVIADERDQSIIIAQINEQTGSLNKHQLKHLILNTGGHDNKGLEGLTIDSLTQSIYAVRERDPMKLFKFQGLLENKPGINIEQPDAIAINELFLDDLSGLYFDPFSRHLLFLSHESKMLTEVDLSGEKISFMDLEAGFNGLKQDIPQAEGVTMDSERNLYIVSEPNLIYVFKATEN